MLNKSAEKLYRTNSTDSRIPDAINMAATGNEHKAWFIEQLKGKLHNLATDPAYAKMIKTYTAKLREWMQLQGDEGASIDKVYQAPKGN